MRGRQRLSPVGAVIFLCAGRLVLGAVPPTLVQPWKTITLDRTHSGAWVVAGDLTGDGAVEIVSARNVDAHDVHYTSAAVAQRLDGSVLWRWGDPNVGRRELHHDVPCQIHDWDNDGRPEVVLCTEGFLVELEGATGREKRRIRLPRDATDCLVFADLSGTGHPSDVLVKTRYTQIWALDREGRSLWSTTDPGGYRTAHQPVPVDLDGDGRQEVLAGYAMLNADGSTRWVVDPKRIDQSRGHCDCFRVVRASAAPEDFRAVMTFCGANGMAMIDGTGRAVWEVTGHHFESVDVGNLGGGASGLQLVVDIDHQPWGNGPVWVFNDRGEVQTKIRTDYARHHALLDWNGDGADEIVVAQPRKLYDGAGGVVAELAMDAADDVAGEERLVLTGDFSGDGVPDILLTTRAITQVVLYRNEHGRRPVPPAPLGTGLNVTLY